MSLIDGIRTRRRALERRHALPLFTNARFLPDRSRAPEPPPAWTPYTTPAPPGYEDVPGERRHHEAEQEAAADAPLHEFFTLHHEAAEFMVDHGQAYIRPIVPRLAGAIHHLRQVAAKKEAASQSITDPTELTAALRAEAERLGMS